MKSNLHNGASRLLFDRARALRNQGTHAEDVLWGYLKAKPLGYKFRRQHPFGIYILDFYCHKLKLVIEVDGSVHLKEDVKKHDEERQKMLETEGLTIMRFTNEEALMKQEVVISSIEHYIGDHNKE